MSVTTAPVKGGVVKSKSAMVGQILRLVDSVRKALFVVGTALLFFIAARNTVTW